jgi:L-rhamnose-H+ transport protein
MAPNPFLGVFFHSVGGLGAGSFYIPFRRVRNWSWETYWLVGGIFTWVVAPLIVTIVTVPPLRAVFRDAPGGAILWTYVFGMGWGIGGLTFGLSLRYLGMSLGMALSLGCCAACGTLIPPLFDGTFVSLLHSQSGLTTLGGVLVCVIGIVLCGAAGMSKERELSVEEKRATIREFNFVRGVWVAIFAGVMSACMAFGVSAGKPIARLAVEHGTANVWSNGPPFLLIFAGSTTANLLWCVGLNARNRSLGDYVNARGAPLLSNYAFCALAGFVAYTEFMFYGMGESQMGRYGFSSFSIHLAFVIIFSNIWGIVFEEWRGTGRRTRGLLMAGLCVLLASALVSGYGNYLKTLEPAGMA